MNTKWMMALGCIAGSLAFGATAQEEAAAEAPEPIVENGSLQQDDQRLDEGFGSFYDTYTVQVTAVGQPITVVMTSDAVDTLVRIQSPGGMVWENDDNPDDGTTNSRIEALATEVGEYTVTATSFGTGETGAYRLQVQLGPVPEVPMAFERQTQNGSLARGDQTLPNGEYADTFKITGSAGDMVIITLDSQDFDTYLVLVQEEDDNFHVSNDDHNGSFNQSQITQILPADGVYEIYVTSFDSMETGNYTLTIDTLKPAAEVEDAE